jgi:acyl carrier protein
MIDPEAIKGKMAEFLKAPPERLEDSASLVSLVQESFVLVQLVLELEEEFDVRLVQEDLRDVRTVGDLVHQIVTHEMDG